MIKQTYFGKQLVRWNGKQPNGMANFGGRDCNCPVDYVKLDPGDFELYEVHYCDL